MLSTSAHRYLVLILPVAFVTSACVTLNQADRPEFAQRAAPRAGQAEIELLAGLSGTLAIEDDCLGVEVDRGAERFFVTLVWPWNARLESNEGRWQVRNVQTGEVIRVGEAIEGSGGFSGDFDPAGLRSYNRMLTRDLSERCAKSIFSLNREFGRG